MLKQFAIVGVILLIAAVALRWLSVSGDALATALKPFVDPLATMYLQTFNSPATAIVLCVVMVVVAAVLLLYYWRWQIAPMRRGLRALAVGLSGVREAPGSEAALHRIDALMRRHRALAKSWSIYRATLSSAAEGRVYAQFEPARYFDMKALELAGLRLRLFLGLPNDFVGVGLVFTFLGLVAGLYFASQSMMSADIGAARDALVLLLHAATFKFLTSITGIGLSLLLSWAQRILIDRLRDALHEVQFQLERLLPLNPAASLPLAGAQETQPEGRRPALRPIG